MSVTMTDLSMSLKGKSDGGVRLPIYDFQFLLVYSSNIWLNPAHLRDSSLQNLNGLDYGFSRSLKVKPNGAVGFTVYKISYLYVLVT